MATPDPTGLRAAVVDILVDAIGDAIAIDIFAGGLVRRGPSQVRNSEMNGEDELCFDLKNWKSIANDAFSLHRNGLLMKVV